MSAWLTRQRISVKLRMTFIALSCGLIAITASIYAALEWQSLRSDLEGQFTNLARMVAHSSRAAVAFADAGGAATMAEAAMSGDQVRGVVIRDSFGNVLAARLPPEISPRELPEPASSQRFAFTDGGSIAHVPIILDDEHIGHVYVLGNNRALDDEKRKLAWMVLGALLAAVLAAALFSLPLDRMVAQPITRLAAEMEQLGRDDDYSRRIEVIGSDEVAGLYTRFNNMLEEIESRDRHIRGERTRLEYEVRSRTADLREINHELEHHVEELRLANEAANAAARTKSEFLANMSHEIRTPMNGVLGMLDLVRESRLNSDQRDHIEMAYHSGQGLLSIINDILDISKIEAGKMEIECTPSVPADLIEGVLGVLNHQALAREVELVHEIEPSGWQAWELDPTRLRQVLLNLVGNAIKFTHQGGVAVICSVDVVAVPATLTILVRDSGIGIPAEVQETLFEAFTQADSSTTRKYGGTGLGLTITQQLVHLMGGTISLESEPGAGSTFGFSLPVNAVAEAADASARSSADELSAGVVAPEAASATPAEAAAEYAVQTPPGLQTTDYAERLAALSIGLHITSPRLSESVRAMLRYLTPDHPIVAERFANVVITDVEAYEPITEQRVVVLGNRREQASEDRSWVGKPVRLRTLLHGLVDIREEESHDAKSTPLPAYPAARVLLVEDNRINQMVASRMLLRFGVRCEVEENGRLGLERMRKEAFDLIFMDCQMPEMDGFEASAGIRALEAARGSRATPIVALTANAMEGDAQRCLDAGMSDYLTKPIETDRLAESLARWLGG